MDGYYAWMLVLLAVMMVLVVPFLIGGGAHALEDLPRLVGLAGGVINLQKEWQLRLTAGRQRSFDKSGMNDGYIDSLWLQIEPQTFEQRRNGCFAGTIRR